MPVLAGDHSWRKPSDDVLKKMCNPHFISVHVVRGDNPRWIPWGDIEAFRRKALNGSKLHETFDEYVEHEGYGLKDWLAPAVQARVEAHAGLEKAAGGQQINTASGGQLKLAKGVTPAGSAVGSGEAAGSGKGSASDDENGHDDSSFIQALNSFERSHYHDSRHSLHASAEILLQKAHQAFLSPVTNTTDAGALTETHVQNVKDDVDSHPVVPFHMPDLLVPSAQGISYLPLWCITQDSVYIMEQVLRSNDVYPGVSVKKPNMGGIYKWMQISKDDVQAKEYFWKKIDVDGDGEATWAEFMEAARRQKDLFMKIGGKSDTVIATCRNHHWGIVHLCGPTMLRFGLHIELNNKWLKENGEEVAVRRGYIRLSMVFKQKDYEVGNKWEPSSGWYQAYVNADVRSFFGDHTWLHFIMGCIILLLFFALLFVDFFLTIVMLPSTLHDLLSAKRFDVVKMEDCVARFKKLLDVRGARSHCVVPFWLALENLAAIVFLLAIILSWTSSFSREIPQVGPYPTDKCADMYADNMMEFLSAQHEHGLEYAQNKFEGPDLASPIQVIFYCTHYYGVFTSRYIEAFVELFFSEMEVHAFAQFLFSLRILHIFSAFRGTVWLGQTVETCINKLLWFMMLWMCLVASFAALLFAAYGVHFTQFATLYKSVYTMVMFSVGFPDEAFEDVHMWEQGSSFMVAVYLSCFAILVLTILMEFFVTIILDAYAQLTGDEGGGDVPNFFKKHVGLHITDFVSIARLVFPNLTKERIAVQRLIDEGCELHTADILWQEAGNAEIATQKPALVVLTGGAIRDCDAFVINSFLQQLFHPSLPKMGLSWPTKVNILGEADNPDALQELINNELEAHIKKRIRAFGKSPLSKHGLEKAKCQKAVMVYILPSMMVDDLDLEDSFNVSIALSLKGFCPTPFRLMLLRPSSLSLAVTCGIQRPRVVTLNLMKTAVLSQNARIQGWSLCVFGTLNNVQASSEAQTFLAASNVPKQYVECLQNRLWGFAIHQSWYGKRFCDFAAQFYAAGECLPICAQIDGKVSLFPAAQLIPENTVAFCIGGADPNASDKYKELVIANADWKDMFLQARLLAVAQAELAVSASRTTTISTGLPGFSAQKSVTAQASESNRYYSPDDPRASDEAMAFLKQRAERCRDDPSETFALLIMSRGGKIWQQIDAFCKAFKKASVRKKLKRTNLVVLLPELPPQPLLDELGCEQEDSPISFIHGQPQRKDVLLDSGIQKCNVMIVFPSLPPYWDPSADEDTFFLLKQVEAMKLSDSCTAVIELSSGKAGAHMLPNIHNLRALREGEELKNLPPEPEDMEEPFSSWFSAGQANTPQAIIGMLANTFYCFGLLEVTQALTVDSFSHEYQPEQVLLPQQLRGQDYAQVVQSLVSGLVGPCPIVPMAILRATPWAKCVLTHPMPHTKMQDDDLLIILANSVWMDWAEDQQLLCLAGRPISHL
eukprot:gnl/MRDRNA2_/MRDRNA2_65152_c0_seq1.p1 gnl/MRDRNA2_/MRDRNA2_65152_c0~~gnl/MRDRNA2_/MRDRNA2_65152_c0_seq1.p1  ORF type:complete len:1544 (+),score=239.79 gnl/MRDRNA2_/MRDRNA2_65152_c0_seq1:276-4634(+)